MKTNNDTPALAIDWTDQEVQGVAFKQALSFSNQLRPRGFELEDLIQELGVVFCKALNAFWKQPVNGTRAVAFDTSGEPTKVAFLGFFKRCCQCKLIELDRKVQRRATVDQTVTDATFHAADDGVDRPADAWLTAVDLHHDRSDFDLALSDAPTPVACFIREFERCGLKPTNDAGTFERIADFCERVTGLPWRKVRPMLQEWTDRTLIPA